MSRNTLSIRKIAFWTIVIVALMYLVAKVFGFISGVAHLAWLIREIASWIAVLLVAILGWQYVAAKHETVWIVLYIIVLLIMFGFGLWYLF